MCFSAAASFGTSGALFLIGTVGITQTKPRSELMLAATPVIFAIQQFSEGMLWSCLTHQHSTLCQQIFTYVFVAFAQSFWPVWIPLSVMMLEKDKKRMKVLSSFLIIGLLIASFLAYRTLVYPISAKIVNHHIYYQFDYPATFLDQFNLVYLIPVVFAHFVSSIRQVQILGYLYLAAFFVSKIFFPGLIFSVWCFFAAGISLYILFILKALRGSYISQQLPLEN